jgi:hypothetical protein
MPFCDPARSIGDRAADMVGRMTLAEKIESLDNSAVSLVVVFETDSGSPKRKCVKKNVA